VALASLLSDKWTSAPPPKGWGCALPLESPLHLVVQHERGRIEIGQIFFSLLVNQVHSCGSRS
jgi:hypothetical protein